MYYIGILRLGIGFKATPLAAKVTTPKPVEAGGEEPARIGVLP